MRNLISLVPVFMALLCFCWSEGGCSSIHFYIGSLADTLILYNSALTSVCQGAEWLIGRYIVSDFGSDIYFCEKELDQDLTDEGGGGESPRYRWSLGLAAGEKLNITRIFNVWFSCSRSSTLLPSQKHREGSKITHNLVKFGKKGKGGLEPAQISGRVSAESEIRVSCRLFQVMMGRRWFHVSQTFSDLGPEPRPSWGTSYELAPAQHIPYPILLETWAQHGALIVDL